MANVTFTVSIGTLIWSPCSYFFFERTSASDFEAPKRIRSQVFGKSDARVFVAKYAIMLVFTCIKIELRKFFQ